MKIKLTNTGNTAHVDGADADLAGSTWFETDRGYAALTGPMSGPGTEYPRHERMHRVVMARILGRRLCPHEWVDHVDGDRLNNCRENLRLATNAENQWNRSRNSNNTTGYKGVFRNPGSKRRPWVAKIGIGGRLQYLGSFATEHEAARAYDRAARRLHGEFARVNLGTD
jgi:hypothetical protein